MGAYGKSQSTAMAVLAMRAAAALIIMQMDKASGITTLNREPRPSVAARPEPELPEPVKEELQTTASKDTTDDTS